MSTRLHASNAAWGFENVGSVPGPDGGPVLTILQREGVMLIADALVKTPFPNSERKRQVQAGPRGLRVAIGLGVDDLDSTYEYCRAAGCEITSEPPDEAWGDRVSECIDPFGYLWEFSQPTPGEAPADSFKAAHDAWFGEDSA